MVEAADVEDPELEELVRANRRGAARRLLAVGALVVIAGGGVLAYGRHLAAVQAASRVQFELPDRLVLFGAIAMIVGALLVLPGAGLRWRARRRRTRLPVAQLRE